MLVVTGAAGFIGSCLVTRLNGEGITNLILVDDFSHQEKQANYNTKKFSKLIERSEFINWFKTNAGMVKQVFHIGAQPIRLSLIKTYLTS